MISKENFIKLFLDLTQYTVPYRHEHTLEKFLPKGYKKDSVGNYYIEIGKSNTLFECHMDTASYEPVEKVEHVIKGNIISSKGNTILGGDDKGGMAIVLGMVEQKIPGVYYFFIGEEKNGIGSRQLIATDPDYLRQFEKSIAFDRKEYGSVVNIQFGRRCCSPEFEAEVVKRLEQNGIPWDKSLSHGMGTDNGLFMDVIPEITNLSTGVFYEHSWRERIDIDYTYRVLKAVSKIDWESLPTVRIPMSQREEWELEKRKWAKEKEEREETRKVRKKEEVDKWMKDYKVKNKLEDLEESVTSNPKFIKNFNDFKNKKGE